MGPEGAEGDSVGGIRPPAPSGLFEVSGGKLKSDPGASVEEVPIEHRVRKDKSGLLGAPPLDASTMILSPSVE